MALTPQSGLGTPPLRLCTASDLNQERSSPGSRCTMLTWSAKSRKLMGTHGTSFLRSPSTPTQVSQTRRIGDCDSLVRRAKPHFVIRITFREFQLKISWCYLSHRTVVFFYVYGLLYLTILEQAWFMVPLETQQMGVSVWHQQVGSSWSHSKSTMAGTSTKPHSTS